VADFSDPIARTTYDRFLFGFHNGHEAYCRAIETFERFYAGDQWSASDRDVLKREGRPAMTSNYIRPIINIILGEFAKTRGDFLAKPLRNGASEEVADKLTRILGQISRNNKMEIIEATVVRDAQIDERGYFDVRMDYSDNWQGEVRITAVPPHEIILPPEASEYDPDTWPDVTRSWFATLDEVEGSYGKAARQKVLNSVSPATALGFPDIGRWTSTPTFGGKEGAATYRDQANQSKSLEKVRIIDRQYYKFGQVREFVDLHTGDTREVPPEWPEEKVQAFSEQFQLGIRTTRKRRVRWTVVAGDVVLHDEWSPYSWFTIVPFFPCFMRGTPMAVIRDLINPQEIHNKTISQMLHIVNTTANGGWIYDSGSLVNMSSDELRENGARNGLILEVSPGRERPEKIKPNSLPTGLDGLATLSADSMQVMSGVNNGMMGTASAEVSGIALENQQLRGLLHLQSGIDNLAHTRQMLADRILWCIQRFYTEPRLIQITGDDQAQTEEVAVNMPTAEGAIINDLTVGEYGITITSMPSRSGVNDSQFADILAMREAGVMIPDHRVIEVSNLRNKADIVAEVKQLTGFGEPTEMDQKMQQLQMGLLQAELEDLLAKIDTQKALTEVNKAKAIQLADAPALEREKLAHDSDVVATEQSVRMSVQRIKELSSQLSTISNNAVKQQDMVERARLHSQNRSNTHDNTNRASAS
jgi:hypothetical protein